MSEAKTKLMNRFISDIEQLEDEIKGYENSIKSMEDSINILRCKVDISQNEILALKILMEVLEKSEDEES